MRKITKKQVLLNVLLIISMVVISSCSYKDSVRANPIPASFVELSGEGLVYISSSELSNRQQISWTMIVSLTSDSDVHFDNIQLLINEFSWNPSPPSNFTLAPGESIQINTTLTANKGITRLLSYVCSLVNTTSNATVYYHYTISDVTSVPGFDIAIWFAASITFVILFTIIQKRRKKFQ